MNNTTAAITSGFGSAQALEAFGSSTMVTATVSEDGRTFTISFDDADEAIKAVEAAKAQAFKSYLKIGGNPRNKRAFGSSFAAVKRAIVKAS